MRTTKAHYKFFDAQVQSWVNYFGLSSSWKVFTQHSDLQSNALAETACDYPSKTATIFLSKDWEDNEITKKELDETAFHEVCEIILDLLDNMAKISCKHDAVDVARHTVIQTLIAAIFDATYTEQ